MKIAVVAVIVFALLSSLALGLEDIEVVYAQVHSGICINSDGSVSGTDKILQDGNVYVLTGNLSSGIKIQKSYITIDGAGYFIEGNGEGIGVDLSNSRGQDPSRTQINNVTVKNLQIINFYFAISNENTNNNTFIGNYIANCDTGFWIIGSANNTLNYNTIKECVTGISINYSGGGNVIVENNLIDISVLVWLSPQPMVDRNYWSNYVAKYPNATEIGNSGIWDTPYNYGASLGNFTDNHPLVNPVIPPSNNENTAPAITPTITPAHSPTATPILSPTRSPIQQPTPSHSAIPYYGVDYTTRLIIIILVTLVIISLLVYVTKRRQ